MCTFSRYRKNKFELIILLIINQPLKNCKDTYMSLALILVFIIYTGTYDSYNGIWGRVQGFSST